MNKFKLAVIKEIQELQKLGVCKNLDLVEQIVNTDLADYENMTVSEATDLLIMLHN